MKYTDSASLAGKAVLLRHPYFGTLYMGVVEDDGKTVQGWVWDDSQRGSSLLPDDYSGENQWMNFPRTCVFKVYP